MGLRTLRLAAALGAALLAAPGCGDSGEPAPPPPTPAAPPAPAAKPAPPPAPAEPAPADAAAGAIQYATFCASCHGAKGDGDGPLAANLDPKPARHSDAAVMNALSDDYLFKVIKEGGAAVGKSPLMAPWGGSLSDAQIRDVVAHIRTLAK